MNAIVPKLKRDASSGRVSITIDEEQESLPDEPRVQRNLSGTSTLSEFDAELAAIVATPAKPTSGIEFEAIIHFTNSSATLNLSAPWKVLAPKTSTGTGFSIGEQRLLTNHHVVRDATSLRVSKHGTPGNYEARVLCESAVCDLALVTVDDPSFWHGLPSVSFQEAVPQLDDTVCAVGYPLGATSVTLTRGVVSNVKLMDLSLSTLQESQLCVQIDAAINPGNSGGPVFNQVNSQGIHAAGLQPADSPHAPCGRRSAPRSLQSPLAACHVPSPLTRLRCLSPHRVASGGRGLLRHEKGTRHGLRHPNRGRAPLPCRVRAFS